MKPMKKHPTKSSPFEEGRQLAIDLNDGQEGIVESHVLCPYADSFFSIRKRRGWLAGYQAGREKVRARREPDDSWALSVTPAELGKAMATEGYLKRLRTAVAEVNDLLLRCPEGVRLTTSLGWPGVIRVSGEPELLRVNITEDI